MVLKKLRILGILAVSACLFTCGCNIFDTPKTEQSSETETNENGLVSTPSSTKELLKKCISAFKKNKKNKVITSWSARIGTSEDYYRMYADSTMENSPFNFTMDARVQMGGENYASQQETEQSTPTPAYKTTDSLEGKDTQTDSDREIASLSSGDDADLLDTVTEYHYTAVNDDDGTFTLTKNNDSCVYTDTNSVHRYLTLAKMFSDAAAGDIKDNMETANTLLENFECDGAGYYNSENVTVLKGYVTGKQFYEFSQKYSVDRFDIPQDCAGVMVEVYFNRDYIPIGIFADFTEYTNSKHNISDNPINNYLEIKISYE